MLQLIVILSLAVIASLILGMLLGKMSERDALQERVDEAYNMAKAEAEAEKANFSLQLSEELNKVRQGIVQSVEAYDSVVRLVEERLPQPASPLLRLEDPLAEHLLIPFRGQGLDEKVQELNELKNSSIVESGVTVDSDSHPSVEPAAPFETNTTSSHTIELRKEIQKENLSSDSSSVAKAVEQSDSNLAFSDRFKRDGDTFDRKLVN